MISEKKELAEQLIQQVEGRLEQNLEDMFTFKLLNELGNTMRKHDDLQLAV